MKPIQYAFRLVTVLALAVLAVGCASNNLLDKENAAVGAGFKVITPRTAKQEALLHKLTPDKVTQITYGGKIYYVLPDVANNQAYVGGPKQYLAYKQFRQTQEKNADNYVAPSDPVQVVEVNSMNWGEWGGWGPMGPMGALGEPGWYY